MPELPDKAARIASGAVHDLLQDLVGVSVGPEVRDRIVEAVVEMLGDEGLILVRRDDVHALVRDEFPSFHDYATAQVRLRAALDDKEKPDA